MHVITHRRIREAMARYPQAAGALDQWYRLVKKAAPQSFAELRALFGTVDRVGRYWVYYKFHFHLYLQYCPTEYY